MKISKIEIVPDDKKYNWREPKNNLDRIYLALLLWNDIWVNNYTHKYDSMYYHYVDDMQYECPLCEIYKICSKCILGNCCRDNSRWVEFNFNGASGYHIYLAILKEFNKLLKQG